jgi:hypothetical protein
MQATNQGDIVVPPQVRGPRVRVFTDDGSQVLQIPTSRADMMALLARRRQISDQLESVTDRRSGLIEQLRTVPEEGRSGLQAQLKVLDSRVVQLENDLGTVGREIAAASPELISMAYEPSGPPSDDSFAQGAAAIGVPLFLVMSAFYFFSRRRWKRQARKAPSALPSALPSADSERLQRLEHGLEAVAIEVERISEGQRFVTKLLSESHSPGTPERVG